RSQRPFAYGPIPRRRGRTMSISMGAIREWYEYDVLDEPGPWAVLLCLYAGLPSYWMTPEQIAERSGVDPADVPSILSQLEREGSALRREDGRWAHHSNSPAAVQARMLARAARGRGSVESDAQTRTPIVPRGQSGGPGPASRPRSPAGSGPYVAA